MNPPPKLEKLLYALGKIAARDSFVEFLEYYGISPDEYKAIKDFLKAELGVDTYC